MADDPLVKGRDYYIEPDGRWVFTAVFLLRRGSCCNSGCRHCPYSPSDTIPTDDNPQADDSPSTKEKPCSQP